MDGVLLNCDYIIALSIHTETTHIRTKAMHNALANTPRFILRIVAYELATVLTRKYNHQTAVDLLDIVTRQSTFFDCANLIAARYYGLKIASFDVFYPEELLVQ